VPLNILLADDSMTAQNMAKKILSEAGYEVTTVSNGAAALKKIAERTPDLVILDIYMPGYTGLEVCERVKRAAATSSMPVLLSVGKLEPYREQDATAVQADGVIIKPFEASELVTIVTNVILRVSGATIDVATRRPTAPTAIQASPTVQPEPLPAVDPTDYSAQPAKLESQAQDAGPAVSYSPTTVSNGDYLGTSQPPVEEKPVIMAAAAATGSSSNLAAPISRAAEANSSMPFMIDELLKSDEKVPAEDSLHRFSGPVLDVSPVEHATEEIEIIDIPAPEPSADTQASEEAMPLSHVAVPAESPTGATGISPDELTALEVETFLRDHAAGAGSELASASEVKFDSGAHAQEGVGAIATGANAMQAPAVENQAAPGSAGEDNQPVFEAADKPSTIPASTSALETAPIVEEFAAQFDAEKTLVAADITAEAVAPAFEPAPAEPPAAVAEVSVAREPEPEPVPASSSPATENEAEPQNDVTTEDFMFSVPMMLEATAAMSLPELTDLGPKAVSASAGSSTFGAPKYAAEAARPAALDEATIAVAVHRVLDRFKPQIVAEIVLELAKHKP
jgi:CheY-like chemotaxis protein